MRLRALIGAALLLALAGCGPRATVEILEVAEPTETVPERAVSESGHEPAFVLNPASQRFHLPWCSWAAQIDEDRRIEYDGDRETLIEVGYEPCHYCNP